MVFIISSVVLALLFFYGVRQVNESKERDIKLSRYYQQALVDWRHIQLWFDEQYRGKKFETVTFMVNSNSFAAIEVSFWQNSDGRLMMTNGLRPSEFVLAINRFKKYLKIQ